MIELPFDKWTLNFYSKDFEDQYESTQNEKRLLLLRIMSFGLANVALTCLILFIIQYQPPYLIFEMSAAFGGCAITIIISGRLVSYLKQAFSFFYMLCVATSVLINYSGVYVPHYVYGYSTALLCVSILQYSHNPLKVVFILVTPTLNLGLFGVLDINYLQYILLTLTAVILLGFLTFQIEYTSRLSFSQSFIIQKQRELLSEFATEPFFSMILNERANSLNLSFKNKRFSEFLSANKQLENDSDTIKEFLRTTFVTSKQEEDHLIDFLKKKGKEKDKFLSLEDFLFQRLTESEGNIKNKWQESNIIMMRFQGSDIQTFKLQVTKLNYGKPILIVQIQLDQQQVSGDTYQIQQEQCNKMIVKISMKIIDSQEQFLQQINRLEQRKNNNINQILQNIQCSNISIIMQLQNYILYFSQNRISNILQKIDLFNFNQIIESLQTYFQCRTQSSLRNLKIKNNVCNFQEIKINSKILIQLIINIFELALNYSLMNDTIVLQIQTKQEIQKSQPIRQGQYSQFKQTEVDLSQEACVYKIFEISFSFITYEVINFNSEIATIENESTSWIQKELQINYKVSSLLLGIIGPYHNIKVDQVQLQDETYHCNLSFEIYSDQTKLDQSFTKSCNKH